MTADLLPSWAVVTPKRLEHIRRVAALLDQWGAAMSLPAEEHRRWVQAGWLHDALRDAPLAQLRELVPGCDWDIELLHGPAAARMAVRTPETSGTHPDVLEAVEWHSVGRAYWSAAGQALYCADFLDPGRSFDPEGRADLARRFPTEPLDVFREVVMRRVEWTERSGWPLLEPTRELWEQLR